MTLATPKDLSRVLAQRPDLDAYIPAEWKHVIAAAAATHELRPYSETRTFLLSRRAHLRSQPAPPVLVR